MRKHKPQYKTKELWTWIDENTIKRDADGKILTCEQFLNLINEGDKLTIKEI